MGVAWGRLAFSSGKRSRTSCQKESPMPPAQKAKAPLKAASPETILKKVDALLADAALDDITTTVAGQAAQLVGAAAVRVYLRDALTDELHCMVPTNKGLRELRLPPDATSVV